MMDWSDRQKIARLLLIILLMVFAGCSGEDSATSSGGATTVTMRLAVGASGQVASGAVTAGGTTVPTTIQSASVEGFDANGVSIAGPIVVNAPNFTVTMTVPNGSGITFLVRMFAATNATGARLYEGTSAQQTLTGAPLNVQIRMDLTIGVTANLTSVPPGAIVNLSGTVSGAPAPATSPLLWSATGGLMGISGVNGASNSWVAPNQPGQYTITANVDPLVNTTHTQTVTGSVVITVLDVVSPVISVLGVNPVTVAHGSTYSDAGATASDNVDGNLTANITIGGTVNTTALGIYSLTYSVSDGAGNIATATRIVHVTDQSPPVITLIGNNPLTVAQGIAFVDPGTTISDNVDPGLTATVSGTVNSSTIGSYTLTYDTTDTAGNVAVSVSRTVNVTDQTPPVIALNGSSNILLAQGVAFIDPGSTVSDNVSTGLSASVSGIVNSAVIGSYTLSYNVNDGTGNAATPVVRTVTVGSDSDGDRVSDAAETAFGSNLFLVEKDHDADGVYTQTEVAFGADPLSAVSIPTAQILGHSDSLGVRLANAVNDAGGENDTNPLGVSMPQGMSVDSVGHRLFVADQANARVLVFQLDINNAIASRKAIAVIGQPDLDHNDTNGAGVANATGLDAPESADFYDDGINQWLLVADSADDRVVIYDITAGITNGMAATKVLGQINFNGSSIGLTQTKMNGPRQARVLLFGSQSLLFVADKTNDRVLVWNVSAGIGNLVNGQAADFVIGAPDFVTNIVTNALNTTGALFDGATSVAKWGNVLFVSDEFNDRILGFDLGVNAVNLVNGMASTHVLGQPNFTQVTNNRGLVTGLGNVNGSGFLEVLGNYLFTTDWGNDRVLVYDLGVAGINYVAGMNAAYIFGQTSAAASVGATAQNRINSPWGLAIGSNTLFVGEETSDRIVSFDLTNLATQITSAIYGPNAVNMLGQTDWVPGMVDGSETLHWSAFGSNDTSSVGVQDPRDMSLGSILGRTYLFLADEVNNRILIFEANATTGVPLDLQADFVIGQANFHVDPTGFDASSVNGPQINGPHGVAFDATTTTLFVSDSFNHRVLMFDLSLGIINGMAATVVLGQPDFTTTTQGLSASAMNTPRKLAIGTIGATRYLAVCDSLNDRVLLFNLSDGVVTGEIAAHVLGQPDFVTNLATSDMSTLNSPYGVDVDGATQRLYVADGIGNRLLVWDLSMGIVDGMAATVLLGQTVATSLVSGVSASMVSQVYDVAVDHTRNRLWVSDFINDRILGFDLSVPLTTGQQADYVIGQSDFNTALAHTSLTNPTRNAYTMNGPMGLLVGPSGDLMTTHFVDDRISIIGAP